MNKRGLTLVEVVVIVAILAILAAIAVPCVIGIAESGAEQTRHSNSRQNSKYRRNNHYLH